MQALVDLPFDNVKTVAPTDRGWLRSGFLAAGSFRFLLLKIQDR